MDGAEQGGAVTRWAARRWGGRAPARPDTTPVPLVVERALPVRASADHAFAVLADPANVAVRLGDPAAFGFVVPGTPVGQVGERRCTVRPAPFGEGLVGALSDVVELVPGRRLVLVPRSPGHALRTTLTAEPTGPDTCVLRATADSTVPARFVPLLDEMYGAELEHDLAAVAHVVAGGPPPPPVVENAVARRMRTTGERQAWALATRPRVTVTLHASVDVAVSPLRAWLALLDAGHDRWWDHDPGATSFTVPGTPAGQVGELRCVLRHTGAGYDAVFAEVMAVDEGRALVTRDRGPTRAVRTTWVDPTPGGARVTRELVIDLLDDSPSSRAHHVEDLRRGLEALARHLHLATPPPPPPTV